MKSLLTSALTLSIFLTIGCSATPENWDDAPVTEAAITTAGMTRMACSEAAMNQETTLMNTLAQVDGYQINEAGVLTLHAADHTVVTAHP